MKKEQNEFDKKRILQVEIEKLPLFLSLKNQTPSVDKKKTFEAKKDLILQEFKNLEDTKQQRLEDLFSGFVYDAGAKDDYTLKDEHFNTFRQVDPKFNEQTKKGVKIYNKRSLLSTAEAAVLFGKKVAFVKFDVSYLRLIDKAGYADFTIRDLASSMNKVAEKYKKKGIMAARTGGDTFCFFLSSKVGIDSDFLEQLRQEVIKDFSKKSAFYLIDESKNLIIKSNTKIKDESDSIILARRSGDSEKILRTLASGRIPDIKDLQERTVTNDEHVKLKKMIEKRQSVNSLDHKKDINKILKTFTNDHPELKEQIKLLDGLIDSGKSKLAEYLLSFLESYYIDPLLDEQVFQGADFFKHLQARQKLDKERIIYVYFPWLKNMNTDLGETEVDIDIRKIYKEMCEQDFSKNPGKKRHPRARKDGGDLIFLSDSYPKKRVFEIDLKNENISGPFKGKIPVFIVAIDYPDRTTGLSQVIDNMKHMGRISFIDWLNKLYKSDENSAQASTILDYYLQDRKEDRCRELLLTVSLMSGISEKFTDKLNSELKKVDGENQKKIYAEFGITPLMVHPF